MNYFFKIIFVMIVLNYHIILSIKLTSKSQKGNDKKNLKKYYIESIIDKSQNVRDLTISNKGNDEIKLSINSLLDDLE